MPSKVKHSVATQAKSKPSQIGPLSEVRLQYSNMRIVEEEGDFLGWDVQVVPEANGYRVIAFVGEGEPEGPFRGHLTSLVGEQTIPGNDQFPDPIRLRFVKDGVWISSGEGEAELVPRHENFIKQELFK